MEPAGQRAVGVKADWFSLPNTWQLAMQRANAVGQSGDTTNPAVKQTMVPAGGLVTSADSIQKRNERMRDIIDEEHKFRSTQQSGQQSRSGMAPAMGGGVWGGSYGTPNYRTTADVVAGGWQSAAGSETAVLDAGGGAWGRMRTPASESQAAQAVDPRRGLSAKAGTPNAREIPRYDPTDKRQQQYTFSPRSRRLAP